MNATATLEAVKEKVLRAATDAERQFAEMGREASRMKTTISEAVEDGVVTARRAVKQAYRAGETLIDDTTRRITRDPLKAVGIAFVTGVVVGCLLPRRARAGR
jgi:ElaB/YqjD/DUF883 family membrane-anchored ribosome-binding protein